MAVVLKDVNLMQDAVICLDEELLAVLVKMHLLDLPLARSPAHPIIKQGVHSRQKDGRMDVHKQLGWDEVWCHQGRRDRSCQHNIPHASLTLRCFVDQSQVTVGRCSAEIKAPLRDEFYMLVPERVVDRFLELWCFTLRLSSCIAADSNCEETSACD